MDFFAPALRLHLLGGDVDPVTPAEMLAATEVFLAGGGTAVIANHDSQSLRLLRRTPAVRAFFEDADLTRIDSLPMILWGRLMGLKVGREHRAAYADWQADFWNIARDRNWRVFHIGGAPGVGERAAAAIRARHAGVNLAVHDGGFDIDPTSAGSRALRRDIDAFDPDVILVGMPLGRQAAWIADNRPMIGRGVFLPVGAAFDQEAGERSAAPRWSADLRLSWLYRLLSRAGRYLVQPWALTPAALADVGARFARR